MATGEEASRFDRFFFFVFVIGEEASRFDRFSCSLPRAAEVASFLQTCFLRLVLRRLRVYSICGCICSFLRVPLFFVRLDIKKKKD